MRVHSAHAAKVVPAFCIEPDRSAPRSHVSAPVDLDSHFFVRRAGDASRAAAVRGRAPARIAHANGLSGGRGNRAFCAVFAAHRRMARSRAQAPGLHRRRAVDLRDGRLGAGGLVARPAVDRLALCRRVRDRRGQHHVRKRGADRAHPDRAPRAAGRGARQERSGIIDRRGHRTRCRRRADQDRRGAARAARGRRAAADLLDHPARR